MTFFIFFVGTKSFLNNICGQSDTSTERQILLRQLSVKSGKKASWINCVRHLLAKYELGEADEYLEKPLNKSQWRSKIHRTIVSYWKQYIDKIASTYTTLKFMNTEYTPGKLHPVLQVGCLSALEVTRLPVRLRLLTGTYK
ncbi:hypothetical protein DPMN_046560 [Dreissena polymorpha]|uniref:Uncharacterized protein n=1 Tax=Dreissena polymorpha TaxID=45954 RepID=A0A9D4HYA3_DREPO|nr:hypothetical protein DPMN_046560 [Dreissena polymorpha]